MSMGPKRSSKLQDQVAKCTVCAEEQAEEGDLQMRCGEAGPLERAAERERDRG